MNGDRLSMRCRARLDDLIRQVFEGAAPSDSDHQATCPDCQLALERIRAVEADMRTVSSEPVAIPARLMRQVMARLRGAPALLTVAMTDTGNTTVAERVVARVARDAAVKVKGVEFASALAGDRSDSGLTGLRVRLVVAYGPPLHTLADAVRKRVRRELAARTGVRIDHIHVSIDDLA